jgi:para-aminobenzoate synthetase component 1
VLSPKEAKAQGILFDINGYKNFDEAFTSNTNPEVKRYSVDFEQYKSAFDTVQLHLNQGDSYLVNLTFPTKIELQTSLEELFYAAKAPYRLWVKDQLLSYSPECFIKIKNGQVFSYPMKGTLDANAPNAVETLLGNPKELWEHSTIVDLIRNDISQYARNVKVNKFRYIERIQNKEKDLLQVSSEIEGSLASNWRDNLGEIIWNLLPAGSISGAPKAKTIDIIQSVEERQRGYYTGVYGYFDGENLDSAVAIRYIEQENNDFYYWSGGGITAYSNIEEEYQELKDKIYVPTR